MTQGETDAYEIEVEGSAEYNNVTAAEADAATEADMPKDNGDISGTGLWPEFFVHCPYQYLLRYNTDLCTLYSVHTLVCTLLSWFPPLSMQCTQHNSRKVACIKCYAIYAMHAAQCKILFFCVSFVLAFALRALHCISK